MSEKSEHLLDYLKKPSDYMTIVALILTIIATFWITSHFQDKKELTIQEAQYNFLTRNEIDESDVNQHIKVYYDGKEIYDPYVIKVTITNTGNQEILENDFKTDKFELFFNENVILYDASVSNAVSQNVEEEIISKLEIRDNRLLISPFLLNTKESFTLSMITNQGTDIFYNFRIVGINNIKRNQSVYISKSTIFLLGIALLLTILYIIAFFKHLDKRIIFLLQTLGIICTLIALILPLYNSTSEITKNIKQFVFK